MPDMSRRQPSCLFVMFPDVVSISSSGREGSSCRSTESPMPFTSGFLARRSTRGVSKSTADM